MAKFKVTFEGFAYIEAEDEEKALDKYIYDEYSYREYRVDIAEKLKEFPRWNKRQFTETLCGYECSICRTTWDVATPYCPYCGAKMEDIR